MFIHACCQYCGRRVLSFRGDPVKLADLWAHTGLCFSCSCHWVLAEVLAAVFRGELDSPVFAEIATAYRGDLNFLDRDPFGEIALR
jgi:hypothetical protein